MSSDKYCCVPGCRKSGGMHKVLHGFPNPGNEREKLRFNSWLYAIGGDILGLANDHIYKYRRVCHSHFEDVYKCRNNRLSNAAIPTLNLSRTSASHERRPMQELHVQSTSKPSTSKDPVQPQTMASLPSLSISNKDMQKENIEPTLPETMDNIPPTIQPDSIIGTNKQTENMIEAVRIAKKRTKKINLNINERQLQKQIIALKIKLSKMKNKIKQRKSEIIAAKNLATNPALLDTINHHSSAAKILMSLQWREHKKKEKGRRFSLKEKILALSIMKQSPRGYRFFRKIFILPAPQTLVKLVQQCNLKPGINKNIFRQMKKKSTSMTNEEKLCVILYDEVSSKSQITYGERKEKVTGFVDNGEDRKPEFADHAQVFMVRGLIKNYKQPVTYTFSSSATKGPELAKQIKAVVTEIQRAGLTVVATVCDQGSNNRHALKILLNETRGIYLRRGEEPKNNIILINNVEIIPLYDPPHLLKGIKNNLMTKNLKFEKDGIVYTAKWSHLQLLHNENPGYKGVKLIPKLTENHINPEKLNKMKVKYASQIFSRTIASNMGYLADKGILQKECKETADLLLFVDNLFDSVNGSKQKNKNAKPLLGPATPYSQHRKAWSESKKILKSMKFMTSGGKEESVPTVGNWVWTLEGIEILLNNLKEHHNITSVWLRHLNQDPLENFFGAVRSHGCRNINPACDQFESAFATLLINNLNSVHAQGKNCENDYCEALHTLIISENVEELSETINVCIDSIFNIEFVPLETKEKDPRKIAPLQYMSGYFLKKAKTNVFKACSTCKNDLMDKNEVEYIKYREYAGRRWLCTPSKDLIQLISCMQDIINEILKENLEKICINEIIKSAIFTLVDFDFIKCDIHKQKLIDYLIKIVNRCLIFNYCKNINKILAGRAEIDDHDDKFQVKAKKQNKKCYKRK